MFLDKIKQLRQETGVSISECKKALEKTDGDIGKAKEELRKWGKELAGKKSAREAGAGIIESYVHPNKKIGVLVDIRCESDFVAKSDNFKNLAHEICLQIAAMSPGFINKEDIPEEILKKEREIYKEQIKDSKKSEQVVKQIIDGKLEKYKEENSLMSQIWIKDNKKTVKDLIDEHIAKLGENIIIKEFRRFEI